jgi:DNA-binding transcriptional regulator YhcF (GntR family)
MLKMKSLSIAETFLGDCIADHRAEGSMRLPSISTLAAQAGVAVGTMSKAVARLRLKGILSVHPRKGINISGTASLQYSPPCSEPPKLKQWERLRNTILKDMSSGVFSRTSCLPSYKEMQSRYHAGYSTLRKAFDSLVDDYGCTREHNHIHLPVYHARYQSSRIILIARGDDLKTLRVVSPRTVVHARSLENICAQKNCTIEILTGYYSGNSLEGESTLRSLLAQAGAVGVAGIIIWTVGLTPQFVEACCSVAAGHGIAVAVLDEISMCQEDALLVERSGAQWFVMANGGVESRSTALYCVNKKYSRLLYIGYGGFPGTVDVRGKQCINMFKQWNAGAYAHAHILRMRPQQHDESTESMYSKLIEEAQSHNTGDRRILDRENFALYDQIGWAAQHRRVRTAVFAVLDTVLARHRPDVIVGYNDMVALACYDHLLYTHHTACPAVLGFDDSFEAYANHLTSYHYDIDRYNHTMLDYLLNGPRLIRAAWRNRGVIEFDGYIVERSSG